MTVPPTSTVIVLGSTAVDIKAITGQDIALPQTSHGFVSPQLQLQLQLQLQQGPLSDQKLRKEGSTCATRNVDIATFGPCLFGLPQTKPPSLDVFRYATTGVRLICE
jgi:hypothetical protein